MHSFCRFRTGLTVVLAALGLSATPVFAQENLEFLINQDERQGRFDIEGDVLYDLDKGLISFDALLGQSGAGSDNPLFCFDFSTDSSMVAIQINDGPRLLVDELGLTSALTYQVSAQTISITPSKDVACFFRAYDADASPAYGDFGLYGQVPQGTSTPSTDIVFQDQFLGVPDVSVVIGSVSTESDGAVSYTITATNNSSFDLDSLALQQSIPLGVDVVVDACQVDGAASTVVCDDKKQDTLRYVGFPLAAGSSLTLDVTARRNTSWSSDTTSVPIHAALVTSNAFTRDFDVAERSVAPTNTP